VRNGVFSSLCSLALAAGVACAQDLQPQDVPDKDKPAISITPAQPGNEAPFPIDATPAQGQMPYVSMAPQDGGYWFKDACCTSSSGGCHIWATLEWMLWSFSDGPIPGPLVTTSSNPGNALSGTLGQSATKILYGTSNLDYGTFEGARLTIGGWFGGEQRFGAEISGFLTEQRSTHFAASSDGKGNPPLYVPVFNTALNREDSLIVSDPVSQFAGSLLWESHSRLWGLEANGIMAGCNSCGCRIDLLAGFRYLDLDESLALANTTEDLTNNSITSLVDRFNTHNQFYGGQLGAKAGYRWKMLTFDAIGKVALGANHNTIGVGGSATQTGANAPTPGTFPGGFLTQPTNIGSVRHDDFCVVPEITIKLGCEIIPGVNAFVGYDFLYMSQVARPGSEVNRNLNLSQSPIFGTGTLSGAPNPLPLNNKTDFIANAFMFGLELKY
jgi:Putative beta barrel porin-7 (BBP7)